MLNTPTNNQYSKYSIPAATRPIAKVGNHAMK